MKISPSAPLQNLLSLQFSTTIMRNLIIREILSNEFGYVHIYNDSSSIKGDSQILTLPH